ncbi:tetratricopeptide repeat protein [Flavobacterium azooxidireducens]|uniref:Tetratricopeptide repeat protein n=1 Tax=Flavobacterium azooxidireducens TaxID=1871076 RepID=A0ABY4KJ92_9FLAO|nr:tetratricopeptide repeat protein [Flavobacterium azooxidireducens]UPQ79813.1 tetratricopeptide repeat protein [Flavobacterium azooxidireducens]
MKCNENIVFALVVALFLCCSSFLFGQTKTEFDSIFRMYTISIYENPDRAIFVGDSIFKAVSNSDIQVKALMLISAGYSSKRNYQKSLEFSNRANELSKNSDDVLLRIKIVNKTAIQYQQLKIYEKTIQYLDEAEELILAYPVRDSVTFYLANNYIVRGLVYKERLNCEIGITFLDKGIKEYAKVNNSNSIANSSIAYYNKGNCYVLLKNNEAAKLSFEESISLAKKISANSLLAFAQKGLAEVYTIEGRYQDAIAILNEAFVTSKSVGDLILNQGIYKGLSENYLALNNWENYQNYNLLYLQNRIRIKESERKSISTSLAEIKKEQKSKLEQLLPSYQYGIYFLIFLSLLIIISSILSYLKIKKENIFLQNVIDRLQKTKNE